MRRRLAILLSLTLLAALASPTILPAAERPIVYVVVIDGLDGDKVEAGKAPFISSLLAGQGARATYFPNSRSVIPAETNPNHAAMMSGAFPDASGIPANAFALYAPLQDEDTCLTAGPFDFTALPSETSGESATCPQAQFAFEAIKRQGNRDRLASAALFGKPKLGRIFAGENFRAGRRDADYLWAPCSSGADDDDYCEAVPTNPISGYAIDDATVMDRVLATIDEGVAFRGARKRPDLTFVNLHQVDSAGHATGTGMFYDQAIALADAEIAELVGKLRQREEWERTVLILVSDHSMELTPQRITLTEELADAGIPEDSFLAVDNGSADSLYLADRRSGQRFALLARMRAATLAVPGVAAAYYRLPNPEDGGRRHTIDAAQPDWHSGGQRSADLLVVSESGATFSEPSQSSNPLPGNHGGPQTRDNFLAVISGGDFVRQGSVDGSDRLSKPMNVDLAPTVMGLFGLFGPQDSRGRFLAKAFSKRELAAVARPREPRIRVRRFGSGGVQQRRIARARLVWRPAGGRYDVQRLRQGKWRGVLKNTRRSSLRLRGRPGTRSCYRVRSIAPSGLKSRFAKRCPRI